MMHVVQHFHLHDLEQNLGRESHHVLNIALKFVLNTIHVQMLFKSNALKEQKTIALGEIRYTTSVRN